MLKDLRDRRILIAEDEYFLARDLATALRAFGARVVGPVATSRGALDLAFDARVDAAILDINLKGGPAYSAADKLLEFGTPFIFSTGYENNSIPIRFGTVPVCSKPMEPERVAEALAKALEPLPELFASGLSYSVVCEGMTWRWTLSHDGDLVENGRASSRSKTRAAALAAAIKRLASRAP